MTKTKSNLGVFFPYSMKTKPNNLNFLRILQITHFHLSRILLLHRLIIPLFPRGTIRYAIPHLIRGQLICAMLYTVGLSNKY